MIEKDSILWAIKYIQKHSDGDLFPRVLEMDALKEKSDVLANKLSTIDLTQLLAGAHRRFIVPKDELSYRQATQLDLQDSILLSAIIYQYGGKIENRRMPPNIVFSYRFAPDLEHGLYADQDMWNKFWRTAYQKSLPSKTVLYCDIADFYNQLYHHTIENQLIASEFPNQEVKWIIRLLESTTAGVSRGVPVGPHPVHLLAEASMIPIDNSFFTQGIDFIRYVDDIIVFCDNEQDAKLKLSQIALILDRQQRLILQRHKTAIYNTDEFKSVCTDMIEDRPINEKEGDILKLINKYSSGDPYRIVFYGDISDEDWSSITNTVVTNIIEEYLKQPIIEFNRLRWFYRRLTQIGHPGGVDVTLANINKLTPCFASVCMYLGSIQKINPHKWVQIGSQLLELLEMDLVKSNEYFRLLLISLFTKNQYINHFAILVQKYSQSDAFVKREIILAAKQNSAFDWLREQKENYMNMGPWQQMSYVFSISGLPIEERKYLLSRFSYPNSVMEILAKWAKEQ
ncbi:MAG: RNA-directed DNA polymerase [Anaerovoracaceae bacterium]